MDSRIRLTVAIPTSASVEEVVEAVVAELKGLKPDLPIEKITHAQGSKSTAVVDIAVEARPGEVLITLSQKEPTPFTLGHRIFLAVGALFLGSVSSMWVPAVLIPAIHFGQYLLDKEAPFTEQQLAAALKNVKERLSGHAAQDVNEVRKPLANLKTTPEGPDRQTIPSRLMAHDGGRLAKWRQAHVTIFSLVLVTAAATPFILIGILYEPSPVPMVVEPNNTPEAELQRYFQQQGYPPAQELSPHCAGFPTPFDCKDAEYRCVGTTDRESCIDIERKHASMTPEERRLEERGCGGGFPTQDQCSQAAQRCAGRTDRDECLDFERKFAAETPEERAARSQSLDAQRAWNLSKVR